MSNLVEATPKPMFRKTHELAKLVRELKKVSKKALDVLEAGLTSQDERVRMMAAEKLLKFYAESAKEVSDDELKRLLLEVKLQGLTGKGSTADEDDDDNTPQLDFENINPEFITDVVDMGDVSKI